MKEPRKPLEYLGFRLFMCIMLTMSYLIVVEHRLQQATVVPRFFITVVSLVYGAATLYTLFVNFDGPPSDDDRHDT